jgi:hypothetical protein
MSRQVYAVFALTDSGRFIDVQSDSISFGKKWTCWSRMEQEIDKNERKRKNMFPLICFVTVGITQKNRYRLYFTRGEALEYNKFQTEQAARMAANLWIGTQEAGKIIK